MRLFLQLNWKNLLRHNLIGLPKKTNVSWIWSLKNSDSPNKNGMSVRAEWAAATRLIWANVGTLSLERVVLVSVRPAHKHFLLFNL